MKEPKNFTDLGCGCLLLALSCVAIVWAIVYVVSFFAG
jgi:hypothetical protein